MCAIQKKVFVDRRQTPFNQILRFAQNDIGGLIMNRALFALLDRGLGGGEAGDRHAER